MVCQINNPSKISLRNHLLNWINDSSYLSVEWLFFTKLTICRITKKFTFSQKLNMINWYKIKLLLLYLTKPNFMGLLHCNLECKALELLESAWLIDFGKKDFWRYVIFLVNKSSFWLIMNSTNHEFGKTSIRPIVIWRIFIAPNHLLNSQ